MGPLSLVPQIEAERVKSGDDFSTQSAVGHVVETVNPGITKALRVYGCINRKNNLSAWGNGDQTATMLQSFVTYAFNASYERRCLCFHESHCAALHTAHQRYMSVDPG